MICFLLYYLFLLKCISFPKLWDASLCSFLIIFFPFFSCHLLESFYVIDGFQFFSTRRNKNRVILGNYLWKENQVSFELFCFLLVGIWKQGQNSCDKFFTRVAMINQKGRALRKHVMQRRKCSGRLVRHRLY